MNLHIMPVKSFLKLPALPGPSAAIISTSADIDKTQIPCPYILAEYMDLDYESPRSFSPAQAADFAAFLKGLDKNITDLFVCCDAGESRSPAIAAAINRWLTQSDGYIWESAKYHPNVLCFCRMLEALGLGISDAELDVLIETNREAFKNALRRSSS